MNLYRSIISSAIALVVFTCLPLARAEEKEGIDLSITEWKMEIDCEQRLGEDNLRYRFSFESPEPPAKAGAPRLVYWPKERLGWYGLNFTTANLNDHPWLRMGVGGSQEKESNLERRPDSEFYLTIGYHDQKEILSNLRLVGDIELRYQLADRTGLDLCVHQLGLLYQTGKIEFGPTLYSRHWTEEDFFAPGFLVGYHSTNTELTVECFSEDIDWRVKYSYNF